MACRWRKSIPSFKPSSENGINGSQREEPTFSKKMGRKGHSACQFGATNFWLRTASVHRLNDEYENAVARAFHFTASCKYGSMTVLLLVRLSECLIFGYLLLSI